MLGSTVASIAMGASLTENPNSFINQVDQISFSMDKKYKQYTDALTELRKLGL